MNANRLKKLLRARGTSLLEVSMALFIGTVVISAAYKTYQFVTVSTTREKQKAELQREIISVSNLIERDIRMAGCGLPGNGIATYEASPEYHQLSCFTNEMRRTTALTRSADYGDDWIVVGSCADFAVGGYACLVGPDTLYRKVTRKGVQGGGYDTLQLNAALNYSFPNGSRILPATIMTYRVVAGTPPIVQRYRNTQQITVGSKLDSILVILKDAAGNTVGASVENATTVTVKVGGHVGTGGNRVFIADSTEVNIRNIN